MSDELPDDVNLDLDLDSLDPDMVEKIADLDADPAVDFDSNQRQADGWLRLYVECPNCQTPMARTRGENHDVAQPGDHRRSRTDIHAVCPDCREVESVLTVYRTTKPFGEEYHPPDPGPPHTTDHE